MGNFHSFVSAGVETKLTNVRVVTKSSGFVFQSIHLNFVFAGSTVHLENILCISDTKD